MNNNNDLLIEEEVQAITLLNELKDTFQRSVKQLTDLKATVTNDTSIN